MIRPEDLDAGVPISPDNLFLRSLAEMVSARIAGREFHDCPFSGPRGPNVGAEKTHAINVYDLRMPKAFENEVVRQLNAAGWESRRQVTIENLYCGHGPFRGIVLSHPVLDGAA